MKKKPELMTDAKGIEEVLKGLSYEDKQDYMYKSKRSRFQLRIS